MRVLLLFYACAAAPIVATPRELAGDWYLTEWVSTRRAVIRPCNADLAHLVFEDKGGRPQVAARRILSVQIGKVSSIAAADGGWRYTMTDGSAWTFVQLAPGLLSWSGGPLEDAGPWVRRSDLDAWERIEVPARKCNTTDAPVVWPAGLARGWVRRVATADGWQAPPEPGTLPQLELVDADGGGLTVVRRSGAGETRWTVDVVDAHADGSVDVTVHGEPDDFAGMSFRTARPAPPPGDVGRELGVLVPVTTPEAAPEPLPADARFISLPGTAPYTAGVWVPVR